MNKKLNLFFYVYILVSLKDDHIYIGYTADLIKRVNRHNRGFVKSTKSRRPFKLIYFERFGNQKQAICREKFLKTTQGRRFVYRRVLGKE